MSKITAVKEVIEKLLRDEKKPWSKYIALAEQKSGVDRLYIFIGKFVLNLKNKFALFSILNLM